MSGKWHGGKGSSPRPKSVTDDEYANRWDAIFQRDIKEKTNEDGEVLVGKPLAEFTEKLDKSEEND